MKYWICDVTFPLSSFPSAVNIETYVVRKEIYYGCNRFTHHFDSYLNELSPPLCIHLPTLGILNSSSIQEINLNLFTATA